jgi:hypothetical protein
LSTNPDLEETISFEAEDMVVIFAEAADAVKGAAFKLEGPAYGNTLGPRFGFEAFNGALLFELGYAECGVLPGSRNGERGFTYCE